MDAGEWREGYIRTSSIHRRRREGGGGGEGVLQSMNIPSWNWSWNQQQQPPRYQRDHFLGQNTREFTEKVKCSYEQTCHRSQPQAQGNDEPSYPCARSRPAHCGRSPVPALRQGAEMVYHTRHVKDSVRRLGAIKERVEHALCFVVDEDHGYSIPHPGSPHNVSVFRSGRLSEPAPTQKSQQCPTLPTFHVLMSWLKALAPWNM